MLKQFTAIRNTGKNEFRFVKYIIEGNIFTMGKIAIIGASYLQLPLIETAKKMGLETHVFAWEAGDPGEAAADYFYPISIIEKEKILQNCQEIKIDGICSIASDLAAITVNYVAANMGLTGNSLDSTYCSTNKHAMRKCFFEHGDPSPRSMTIMSLSDLKGETLQYPLIVKPSDRSGSRGVTKLDDSAGLENAIEKARSQSFEKKVLIEEFAEGREYSVECISWDGEHHLLAVTKKYTTGAPHFIETAHLEPALLSQDILSRVRDITFHALDSLQIKNGASHTELKIADDGSIKLIEVGGRMGGDCIGSDLVKLSTGIDFVQEIIKVSLGQKPALKAVANCAVAAVRFICTREDLFVLEQIKKENPQFIVREEIHPLSSNQITDSSSRHGYYLLRSEKVQEIMKYLPREKSQ